MQRKTWVRSRNLQVKECPNAFASHRDQYKIWGTQQPARNKRMRVLPEVRSEEPQTALHPLGLCRLMKVLQCRMHQHSSVVWVPYLQFVEDGQLYDQVSLAVIFCFVVWPTRGFRAAVLALVPQGLSFIRWLLTSHSPSQFIAHTYPGVTSFQGQEWLLR